jgi:hypothetical protein
MRTDHGAIHHAVFHVGVVSKVLQHPFPHAVVTPVGKAFVDTIPLPVFGWQEAPLRPTAIYPDYGFHELSALGFIPNIGVRVCFQKIPQLCPLIVT